MQQTLIQSAERIPGEIKPPAGWEVTENIASTDKDQEQEAVDNLKRRISLTLPYVTTEVEQYIHTIYEHYDIFVFEADLWVEADATFHLVLLVNEEDYHSPKLMAAKILAEDMLKTGKESVIHFRFAIAEQYYKLNYVLQNGKIQYTYRNTRAVA